jgi:regulator of ribonuclease activity A
MSSLSFTPTCDLYDTYLDQARVPSLYWQSYGGRKQFCGPAVTIKCFEDNSRLKECTEIPGNHRVLVVDAGGSNRCAVMGDMLAASAASNQWAGIVVYGCVRDVTALSQIDLGIVALGTTPRKSTRRGEGSMDLPITIGNVTCNPGDYVYVDQDGVLILDPKLVK